MIKPILKKMFVIVAQRESFQPLFEIVHRIVLRGMNIGGGADLTTSGELAVMKYIKQNLPSSLKDITIFDVGANVGLYSLKLNEIFGGTSNVYAFEPAKFTFNKLVESVKNLDNVRCYNFGFSSESAQKTLFSNPADSGLSSVYDRRIEHFNLHLSSSEVIQLETIDGFCEKNGIKKIHLLKLDVEGHELKVLAGASKMLANVDYIQFEFGGSNIDSRTYFQDFYYMLKDTFKIYRILPNGLFQIKQYKEEYEVFRTTNFLAERVR